MRRLSLWMRNHPMVGDSLVASVLLSCDMVLVLLTIDEENVPVKALWLITPLNLLMVLPVVFRRKRPVVAAYLALLISTVHSALQLGVSALLVTAVMVYTLLVYVGRRQGALYGVVLSTVSVVASLFGEETQEMPLNIALMLLTYAFCWVLGEFVGARRAYMAEMEARLHLLETERDQATRIAVAAERSRIARELHDVVAHAVSVMVVQADGASYAIRSNPDLAENAVRTISETGRTALSELRRLLDVLRGEDSDNEPRVPQPNADSLAELADRITAAGVPVEVDLNGGLGVLPTSVSLGVYRIVQESLTNTLKHAGPGTKAVVRVHRDKDKVAIEVADDGTTAARARQPVATGPSRQRNAPMLTAKLPGGNGLIGMRERANVLGGTLAVGPRPGGGWQVKAELPVRLDS